MPMINPFPAEHRREIVILTALYALFIAVQFIGVGDYMFAEPFNKRDGSIYWSLIIGGIFNGLIFFANIYWSIPQFLSRRKYGLYVLVTVLGIAVSTVIELLLDHLLMAAYELPENLKNLYNYSEPFHRRDISAPPLLINILVLITAVVYRFAKDWIANERIKGKLKEEKLNAELSFLKSQLNPHLLFNTLNTIFSMARENEDYEVADAIQKLSDIMRYMLYDSGTELVSLDHEIALIKNLVELQKLRVSENESTEIVSLNIEGDTSTAHIAPLILIPFIENALKYGFSPGRSTSIVFEISLKSNELRFRSMNKIFKRGKNFTETESGVGLSNAKRRLELLYPQKHELEIDEKEDYFEVMIKIQL